MRYRARLRFVLESVEALAVLTGAVLSWPLSRRWLNNWGSLPAERKRNWPGDKYVPAERHEHTRGIHVEAPASAVWPWVVQFGLDRAGFYSYELLERVAGIPVKNVESIEASMQELSVGDEVRLHPEAPGIPVAELETERRVCFAGGQDSDVKQAPDDPVRSWSIYLEPAKPHGTRLILRGCVESVRPSSWKKRVAAALEKPIDFTMEQRMLRTIKRLAEQHA